ncbi:hypothetical protein K438DRAFT_1768275 [Mycena galopus ATCC 62051]|nr:hypothetical protein K438DRAFT_1768275 [Mycena galopus ATCC 62051]
MQIFVSGCSAFIARFLGRTLFAVFYFLNRFWTIGGRGRRRKKLQRSIYNTQFLLAGCGPRNGQSALWWGGGKEPEAEAPSSQIMAPEHRSRLPAGVQRTLLVFARESARGTTTAQRLRDEYLKFMNIDIKHAGGCRENSGRHYRQIMSPNDGEYQNVDKGVEGLAFITSQDSRGDESRDHSIRFKVG